MTTTIFNNNLDENSVNLIVKELQNGAVGIFPTDTVYGIGCSAFNENALQNLYKIKQRDLSKPINMLVSNIDMIKNYVKEIHPIEQTLMENFWPGNLTIIFDKSKLVPDLLTAGKSTIGIRIPDNQICLEIISKLGIPLAMSSANIANKQPDTSITELLLDFSGKVDFILDTGEINGVPSTIVRVEDNELKIVREGSISFHDMQKCLGGNTKC